MIDASDDATVRSNSATLHLRGDQRGAALSQIFQEPLQGHQIVPQRKMHVELGTAKLLGESPDLQRVDAIKQQLAQQLVGFAGG